MNSTIDIDSHTLKMLKYLYDRKENGCLAEDFINHFGKESSAYLLEFCRIGYIAFSCENHAVNEQVFSDYIKNRISKNLPLMDGKNLLVSMPKANKIVESNRKSTFMFWIPLLISVISLLISAGAFAYTVFDDSTVKVEIVKEQ